MLSVSRRTAFLGALGLATAGAAWAFPWDIDMVDGAFYRAYEWKMGGIPEGAVSRNMWVQPMDRMKDGDALANPLLDGGAASPELLATGQTMFSTYCTPCHGVDGKGGAPVTDNNPEAGKRRYPLPPPMLSGPGAISTVRSDGYIYLTVRNGGAIMPGYSAQMSNDEMWAVVAYIRTLEGAAYNPPSAQ